MNQRPPPGLARPAHSDPAAGGHRSMLRSAEGRRCPAGVYFCPHAPEENCLCRKPKPGMILEARQTLNIDLKKSWMIGDKMSDIEAGKDAGVQTILITSAYVKNVSEKKYDDLAHAVEYILQTDKSI